MRRRRRCERRATGEIDSKARRTVGMADPDEQGTQSGVTTEPQALGISPIVRSGGDHMAKDESLLGLAGRYREVTARVSEISGSPLVAMAAPAATAQERAQAREVRRSSTDGPCPGKGARGVPGCKSPNLRCGNPGRGHDGRSPITTECQIQLHQHLGRAGASSASFGRIYPEEAIR